MRQFSYAYSDVIIVSGNCVVMCGNSVNSVNMLKHACNSRLGVDDYPGSDTAKARCISDELQCIAKAIVTADEHTFSIERFSSPRGSLVIIRAITIALSQ